ncbi:MAG: DUF4212 domain-containing protein [Undibacterium sp.]|nr:DUF4212 domain-containing protein [Undibacterium sp.]
MKTHLTQTEHARPRPRSPWFKARRLTMILLFSWFMTTFFSLFFARELDQLILFGWSLSFYMAAQGLTILYVLILGIYSFYMWRIEEAPTPVTLSDVGDKSA